MRRTKLIPQTLLDQPSVTLEQATAWYLTDCEMRGFSHNTLSLNRIVLCGLSNHTNHKPVNLITPNDLRQFILKKSLETSPSTAARYCDAISPFFKFLVSDGLLATNPMANIKKPKVATKPIEPLAAEQVKELLDVCDGTTFVGIRDKLVVTLLYDCGFRATELTSLAVKDVDLIGQTVLIRESKTNKPRVVPFGKSTRQLLQRYLSWRKEIDCPFLVVGAYGDATDRYRIGAILKKLSRRAGVKVNPHKLRHSCAVGLLRNGANAFEVQKVLGHASLAMTRRYSQVADTDLVERYKTASPADRVWRSVSKITGKKKIGSS